MSYYDYWAKAEKESEAVVDNCMPSYHLLPYHLLDVAAVAYQVVTRDKGWQRVLEFGARCPVDDVLSWLLFGVGLHDVGKLFEGFQNLRPDVLVQLGAKNTQRAYVIRHDELALPLLNGPILRWMVDVPILDAEFVDEPDLVLSDWRDLLGPWLGAIAGHHGKPVRGVEKSGSELRIKRLPEYLGSDTLEDLESLLKSLRELFIPEPVTLPWKNFEEAKNRIATLSWPLAGLIVLSDWLGSSSYNFPMVREEIPLQEYWNNYAMPLAKKAVDSSGVIGQQSIPESSLQSLFAFIKKPSPLQSIVGDLSIAEGPQLFILEDVTGSGKTEAALLLSHRLMARGLASGIFIGLPTMATANAMYGRMAEAYSRLFEKPGASLILAHSARHLSDDFLRSIENTKNSGTGHLNPEQIDSNCTWWLADNRKKALLASIGVGTIDQALLGILPSKHQSLRLLGLSRNVLIVDEVHAYDAYMQALLAQLILFQTAQGGSTILLSATLPLQVRGQFLDAHHRGLCALKSKECPSPLITHEKAYPLLSHQSKIALYQKPVEPSVRSVREVHVHLSDNKHLVLDQIIERAGRGECVCWVRNTVDDAIEAWKKISNRINSESVHLFHARFTMGDRLAIEQEMLERFGKKSSQKQRSGQILVSTQVVEQSLDLDFDLMVSDLAPIDLILQRMGRLQRHERGARVPIMLVHGPLASENASAEWLTRTLKRTAFVYPDHGQLWLTARALSSMSVVSIPSDVRCLIDQVYSESALEELPGDLLEISLQRLGHIKADTSLAHHKLLAFAEGYQATIENWIDDTMTPTRLGDLMTTLRLAVWENGELCPWWSGPKAWDMSQVNVRQNRVVDSVALSGTKAKAVEDAVSKMPDQNRWSVLLPMEREKKDLWQGHVRNGSGKVVPIYYSKKAGMQFSLSILGGSDGSESTS